MSAPGGISVEIEAEAWSDALPEVEAVVARAATAALTAAGASGEVVVLLTDGRATGGPDPLARSRIAAVRLAAEGAAAVVVDCETSYVKLGLAADLAGHLRAPVLRLEHLHADHLTAAVRRAA